MSTSNTPLLHFLVRVRTMLSNDQVTLGILAVVVGLLSGGAVVGFRETILFFHEIFFGADDERLFQFVQALPWWQLILVPTLGGLLVGLLVKNFLPEGRPQGVADVIEASALQGGRMSATTGIKAAIINALSIGVGASVGREGPAVHLGAALAALVAKKLHLTRSLARTLLGCGVAAAVAGSFNAPIAGALFANEVVIGHYALKAFAPVVIASVTGTAITRAVYGGFPAFVLPEYAITSYFEFPSYLVLGILGGLAASLLMRGINFSQDVAARVPGPQWLRPMIGGFVIGLMALALPHVLGVGYGVTEKALIGAFPLAILIAVLVGKIAATSISLGFGFGGGIFSPSMVIGAVLGGVYGVIITHIFPGLGAGIGAYALVGMGAVASATLGAPISTTLIIFEMTGDYELTTAVMLAVVVATGIFRHLHSHSFFTAQLERRGLDLKGGFERALLVAYTVGDAMRSQGEVVNPSVLLPEVRKMLQLSQTGELFVVSDDGRLLGTITLADLSETAFDPALDMLINAGDVARAKPPMLAENDTLEVALQRFSKTGEDVIAVVDDKDSRKFIGCIREKCVMTVYNRALLESRHEEHD